MASVVTTQSGHTGPRWAVAQNPPISHLTALNYFKISASDEDMDACLEKHKHTLTQGEECTHTGTHTYTQTYAQTCTHVEKTYTQTHIHRDTSADTHVHTHAQTERYTLTYTDTQIHTNNQTQTQKPHTAIVTQTLVQIGIKTTQKHTLHNEATIT